MKLKLRITIILVACVVMVIVLGFYFSYIQLDLQKAERVPFSKLYVQRLRDRRNSNNEIPKNEKLSFRNLTITSVAAVAGININNKLQSYNFSVSRKSSGYLSVVAAAKNYAESVVRLDASPWSIAAGWVKPQEIHPENVPELGYVLHAMTINKIIGAGIGYKGSQLKMMLILSGGQEVIFKPIRYTREYIVTGSPYAGADRHNGEIAAFHLNRLLGLCRTPLAVGRLINLRTEILPVASKSLKKTFFTKENNTCFYGHCFYCSPADPACGQGDILEGAVILMLPEKYRLKKYRSPWQRTYKDSVSARWEHDFNYCGHIMKINLYKKGRLLLDLIDASIFDYLIGNADRHHYEVFADFPDSAVILLDNGKSFGNPYWDELTILAPLYQCCRLRRSTYERLWTFVNYLGFSVKELLSVDQLSPVLSEPHFEALDRRLRTVLAAIEVCFDEHGEDNVLIKI